MLAVSGRLQISAAQDKHKLRSPAWGSVDPNLSSVRCRRITHNGETDSNPRRFPAEFGANAVKGFENAGAFRGRDAGAFVAHRDKSVSFFFAECEMNPAARRRKLEGVVEQIENRLTDRDGIEFALHGFVRETHFDRNLTLLGKRFDNSHRVPEQRSKVRKFVLIYTPAPFAAGEGEHIFDCRGDAPGLTAKKPMIPRLLLRP
jgi:hypothetical protein